MFTDGDWVETKDQSPNGIRLVQTGNIGEGKFQNRADKARYINEATLRRLRCTEIYSGDCLVSRLPDPVGRACIIPQIEERMITAVDCTILRTDNRILLPEFFEYYSQSKEYLVNVDVLCTGATRRRISRKNLGTIQIPLPPLAEQQRIVAILDEAFEGINRAIANTEKNLANTRELFESYLRTTFSERGEGWIKTSIGEQITLQRGFDITKKQQRPGVVPVISSGGAKSMHNEAKAQGPGVILGRKGSIGSVHYVESDYWPHDTTLWVKDFKGNNPRLAFYIFKSMDLAHLDTGAANPALNRNLVHPLHICWPEVKQQETLVRDIEEFENRSNQLENAYQGKRLELVELKRSVLSKAFAGELTSNLDRALAEAGA